MSVAGKAIRGAIWSVGGSIGARIVGVIGTLILTRFLSPAEAGEVGVAAILVLSASQLSSFGFGQFVASKPGSTPEQVFHAAVYHVGFGVLALAILFALRGLLGPLFDAPQVAYFVPGLAAAMLCDRIAYIPERVLVRDMHFRVVAMTRAFSELVFAAVSVGLAWRGFGAMSIVWANIAQSGFRLLVFVIAAPRPAWLTPHPLRRAPTAELLSFGWPVYVGSLTNFFSRKWDNLIFARIFGPGQMGLYNLAYNLADIPATQVGESVADVLVPSFARIPAAERGRALVRATAVLAIIIFPLAVGLGAVAPSLVAALFNEEWQRIAPLLLILSVLSVVRPVSWTVGSFLYAENRPRLVMVLEVGKTILLLGAVAGLATFGTAWACVGVGVAFSAAAVGSVAVVHRYFALSVTRFLPGFVGPLVACVPMVGAVLGVRHGLRAVGLGQRPLLSLLIEIVAGAAIYVPSVFLFARGTARDCVRFTKNALARRRGGETVTPGAAA